MKKLKIFSKKILIIYLIFYIIISSMSACFARGYDEKCGEYLVEQSKEFIEKYQNVSYYVADREASWSGGEFGKGDFYSCCTSGIKYFYEIFLGVDIYEYGFQSMAADNRNVPDEYWDKISVSEVKPGDILVNYNSGHVELVGTEGGSEHLNTGSSQAHSCNIHPKCSGDFGMAIRLKNTVEVNPTGTVPLSEVATEYEDEDLSIYDENGFLYSGVGKIDSYENSPPLWKWIIDTILEIMDYLIGILTLGERIVIVGWTGIVEGWISDLANSITGVDNDRVDEWQKDPNEMDDIDQEAQKEQQQEVEQSEATGQMGDPNYISEGVQAIADMGGTVQLRDSESNKVTVENMVYNKIPILDANIFNFDSAGGAKMDKDGIVYTLKENTAMWYYIFRVLSIAVMLVMLIYLGLKMALTTVSEKKAVYKEMLISWVAGFILVFGINYIMYAILTANDTFIQWIIPKYEDGTEVSLYEILRSKAYEIKFTTGFTGMIMYIILIYYAIRFAIVYIKRFLTIIILALMSPFVAVSYAFEKINKKGKNKAEIFGNWLKDFTYTVGIQSMHALIYTIFISTIIKLTESSLVGILLAFTMLNGMLKIDPLLRKMFMPGGGKNANHLSVPPLAAQIGMAKGVKDRVKPLVATHGNVLKKGAGAVSSGFGKGVSSIKGKIDSNALDKAKQNMSEPEYKKMLADKKQKDKEKAAKKQKLEQVAKASILGGKIAGHRLSEIAKNTVGLALLGVEPGLGASLLDSADKSGDRVEKLIEQAKKNKLLPKTINNNSYMYKEMKSRQNVRVKDRVYIIDESKKGTQNKRKGKTEENKKNSKNKNVINTIQKAERMDAKINISNMRLVAGDKKIQDVLLDEGILKATAYADILAKAQTKENEIIKQYNTILGKINNQSSELDKINPDFEKRLKQKQAIELEQQVKTLLNPLNIKDIEKAVEKYDAKTPTFNIDTKTISKDDIDGITDEINNVLLEKEESIQMSEEFKKKVEEALEQSGMLQQDESESKKSRKEERTWRSEREKQKADMNNPYADSNRNAPKQNTAGSDATKEDSHESSIDRLVKNIQNSSKGADSKETSMSKDKVDFAKNVEQLSELGKEASNISGSGSNNIDDIMNRLRNL